MKHLSRVRGHAVLVTLTLGAALLVAPAAAQGDEAASTGPSPTATAPPAATAPGPLVAPGRATATAPATAPAPVVDTLDRAAVAEAYNDRFLPAYQTPLGWTGGSADACDRGELSTGFKDASLEVVNYLRAQAGIGPVTFDAAYDDAAQEAALIMAANDALSHGPPTSWRCWSQLGYDGASRSNLYLGLTGTAALVGYMSDPGAHNTYVGHRTWILNPRVRTMGVGATSGSHALHVIAPDHWEGAITAPSGLVTWPTAGYFPRPLIPDSQRWSVHAFPESRLDVSLAGATVRVVPPGGSTPLTATVEHRDDTLVVFTNPWATTGTGDARFRVTLGNLTDRTGNPLPDHTYTVDLVDPDQSSDYIWTAQPTVTGTGKLGEPLTAAPGTYTPADGTETVRYAWYRDGVVVGTGRTYVPTADDAGLVLRLQVTVTGVRGESATSVAAPPIERLPGPRPLSRPEIYGEAYPGGFLGVIDGGWDEDVERYAYHWLRDGERIAGVTEPWYVPTAEDVGSDLVAVVTAWSAVDGEHAEARSAPVRVLRADQVTHLLEGPVITGDVRVGGEVRASAPVWNRPVSDQVHRWYDDRGRHLGEGPRLIVPAETAKGTLWLQVEAVDADGTMVFANAQAGPVRLGAAPTSAKPLRLRGKARVGRTLRAVTGAWTPAEVTARYRWLRDGKRIRGADGRRYTVVKRDRGHRIKVRVVAKAPGHVRATQTSPATRRVPGR